jgi:hypothetical protein
MPKWDERGATYWPLGRQRQGQNRDWEGERKLRGQGHGRGRAGAEGGHTGERKKY